MLKKLLLALMLVGLLTAAASAGTVNSIVLVWNGNIGGGGQVQADIATAINLSNNMDPTWQFFYDGPINFINNNPNGGSNTFGDFFGGNASGISGLSPSDLSSFLGTTMSDPGTGNQTLMALLFELNTTGFSGSVNHDDGASLYYLSGPDTWTPVFESPAWTAETANAFTLPDGDFLYALIYVEANGSPADLTMDTPAVPEPASLMLFGSGLVGLAGTIRRKLQK